MGRNGSGVYSLPPGSTVANGDTSDASDVNTPLADLESDANTARPIVAGGTGATTKLGAQQALDLEPGVNIQAYNANLAKLSSATFGTAGQILRVNNAATGLAFVDRVENITTVNSTSGTAIDVTSIPAWASTIIITYSSVSMSGTDQVFVQIGDSGGVEATGYTATKVNFNTAGTLNGASSAVAFLSTNPAAAGDFISGTVRLNLHSRSSNIWVAEAMSRSSTTEACIAAGVKSLTGTLDRIRFLTSGSTTFDNGNITVSVM